MKLTNRGSFRTCKRCIVILIIIFFLLVNNARIFASEFKLNISWICDLGYASSSLEQEPYESWQDNYIPWGGSMETDIHNSSFFFDLGLEIEPSLVIKRITIKKVSDNKETIQKNAFSIGVPIFYSINCYGRSPLSFKKTIAEIGVDWWDPVPLHRIRLKKASPGIGFCATLNSIRFQIATQKYNIISEDYKGVDVYGGQNTAKVIHSKTIEKGWGTRLDIMFLPKKENHLIWGIFFEKNGSKVIQTGFVILIDIN